MLYYNNICTAVIFCIYYAHLLEKQQAGAVSLPDRVISPLRSYRKLIDPPTERWSVFLALDQRTLAGLV